jgi:hypothetical protein
MAAVRRNHSKFNESCREKIQTTQLILRLQDHALGIIELDKTQIDAIKILLGKTLPDLSAVAIGDMSNEQTKQVFGWMPTQK